MPPQNADEAEDHDTEQAEDNYCGSKAKEAANDPKTLQTFESTMRKLRQQTVENEGKAPRNNHVVGFG